MSQEKVDPRRAIITCPNCLKEQDLSYYAAQRFKYCSRKCADQARWVSGKKKCEPLPMIIYVPKNPVVKNKPCNKTVKPAINRNKRPKQTTIDSYNKIINLIIELTLDNKLNTPAHIAACNELNKIDKEDMEYRCLYRTRNSNGQFEAGSC